MARSGSERRPRGAERPPLISNAVAKRFGAAVQAFIADDGTQPPSKDYALGILFIHGMGEQARGDTITEMGDATTEWLRRWLGNDGFRLEKAELRSREGAAAGTPSPATSGRGSATVVLRRSAEREGEGQRWLLAESWWADAFRPASFTELAWWAIGVGPWLIASQLAGLRERLKSPLRGPLTWLVDGLVFVLLFLVAAVVAALIAPLAILLLLLSLIPLPFVGVLAQSIARNLAGSFGDLLVFVRSPVRFAAMAERVREDVEALGSGCERVMIVAHSQGSAVAWHAIRRTAQAQHGKRREERTPLVMFVTFGQAFRKLKALHRLHTRVGRSRQFECAIWALASTVCLLLTGIATYSAVGLLLGAEGDFGLLVDTAWPVLVLIGVLVGLVGGIQTQLAALASNNDAKAQDLILGDLEEVKRELRNFRWLDLWASADPAPNGQLFSVDVPKVDSYRLRNLGSTLLDHSVYWSNMTEFVSAIVFAASSLVQGAPTGSEQIPVRLRRASATRDVRVTALAAGRVVVAAAFVAAIIGFREVLPDIGSVVVTLLLWIPFVPDDVNDWPGLVRGFLGAAVIAATAALAWRIWVVGWNAVIHSDELRFFNRQDEVTWPASAQVWAWSVGVVPTALMIGISLWWRDATFFLVYAGFAVAALLVVARMTRSTERRFSN